MKASTPKDERQIDRRESFVSVTVSPMAVGTAAMQAWMDVGAEAVRFVWDRLQQDIKTQQAMLGCTSLDQMQKVQAEFFRSAQDQYAAEGRRMMEMVGKAATAGWAGSGLARRYDDVPL
jgi:hypothetical protein